MAKLFNTTREYLVSGTGSPPSWDVGQELPPLRPDAGSTLLPAGSARAGLVDTVSQIEQRPVQYPKGTDYLAIEGDSGGDVFRSGQLVVLAPANYQPKPGDIAAIYFTSGPMFGQRVVKWISTMKHKGYVQLDSKNVEVPPIMCADADWAAAEKRLVIGAVFRPDLLR